MDESEFFSKGRERHERVKGALEVEDRWAEVERKASPELLCMMSD